jgi:hypothetical protein
MRRPSLAEDRLWVSDMASRPIQPSPEMGNLSSLHFDDGIHERATPLVAHILDGHQEPYPLGGWAYHRFQRLIPTMALLVGGRATAANMVAL